MDRHYLKDNHQGWYVFAKCYCGHRWETEVGPLMEDECPSCSGMLRISYSFTPYKDSLPANYDKAPN